MLDQVEQVRRVGVLARISENLIKSPETLGISLCRLANRRLRNICCRRRMDRSASCGPLDKTGSAYFAPIRQV